MKSLQSKPTVNAARASLGLSPMKTEQPQEEKQPVTQSARASLFSATTAHAKDEPEELPRKLSAVYLNSKTGQLEEWKGH